ncbi:2-succinyl-5-enolpyruvyl-6-hydroxy-3-cyclohexene -1-carboxylatesynthase [Thalassoporum mexicanum PCC 7367]|uniref:2-succinyl-5-enolpyruvyl-6-hydroxy-3- cyclohexene-1-carboxylic-acid synthase n=1 Tax=Thalassoporum mexicanum TaxID=3457544 RepID=UPI00029FF5FE|nr:2-succinyl-5-enolpyruvyl-6-hydroxy-3-cyclohexene-1-carboxylic-acid synthase [Pseudanabaena sp. PCC 7367]AFY70794.1 2-succinyl-5-enolpyruvyl-6-hydroxy-3-cyclohexene -1-carboxylatesynthase [Pseudanabaena sp. PCC 7367]
MNTANRNSFWASLVAAELDRAGVSAVCISPGSRSTPLAIACYQHPHLQTIVHIDERSGSFFGLGLAKYTRATVALICTSGTAAANFYPAIIEAFYAQVPLIVLTADRPPELRDCGAGQTIDQIKLYGDHVRYFFEVGLPDLSGFKLRHLRSLIGHATAIATGKTASAAGPVHLNFAFADPLPPIEIADQVPANLAQTDRLAWQGRELTVNSWPRTNQLSTAGQSDNNPNYKTELSYIQVAAPQSQLSQVTLAQLGNLIATCAKGIIVVGVYDPPAGFAAAVKKLAQITGYPLLGEATGIMRDRQVIGSYDVFLRSPQFCQTYAPELVIRFGAMPTAKSYRLWLEQHLNSQPIQQIIVGDGSNNDPTHGLGIFVHADALSFCEQLSDYLAQNEQYLNLKSQYSSDYATPQEELPSPTRSPQSSRSAADNRSIDPGSISDQSRSNIAKQTQWQQAFWQAEKITIAAIAKCLAPIESLFEGKVFDQLGKWLPIDCCIYVASSMPIRDLDSFFRQKEQLSPESQSISDPERADRLNQINQGDRPSRVDPANTPISSDDKLASEPVAMTRVIANRGANGIDGTISSALGAAWGSSLLSGQSAGNGQNLVQSKDRPIENNYSSNHRNPQPVILICGDLAFYHDLNGLMAVKQYQLNLTIILLNNNGGGIFDMLPIAQFPEVCEPLFNTPHDLDFAPIVAVYGCEHVAIESWAQFKTEVLASLTKPGTQVLELKSNRQQNHQTRQQIWQEVKEAIADHFSFNNNFGR